MRAIGLLAVLATSTASAEPAKPGKPGTPVTLPDVVKEAAENAKLAPRDGVRGVDGQVAAGIVITPPYHPDAEPVAKGGIWHEPPDPNDPMALELGTRQLRSREKLEPWWPRDLSRGVKRWADRAWDLLLPKL